MMIAKTQTQLQKHELLKTLPLKTLRVKPKPQAQAPIAHRHHHNHNHNLLRQKFSRVRRASSSPTALARCRTRLKQRPNR